VHFLLLLSRRRENVVRFSFGRTAPNQQAGLLLVGSIARPPFSEATMNERITVNLVERGPAINPRRDLFFFLLGIWSIVMLRVLTTFF